MSILSKVKGKESPTYWDLFCEFNPGSMMNSAKCRRRYIRSTSSSLPHMHDCTADFSGAIAALASHIARMSDPAIEQREGALDPDRAVLERMTRMFEAAFGLKLDHGRLSPV